jgi:hypothetical protein
MDMNEEHMLEYMQEGEDIRKEIIDYAIVADY